MTKARPPNRTASPKPASSEREHSGRSPSGRFAAGIAALTLGAACYLLFFHLGHYGLWGDESDTALFAQAILRTGDTSGMVGNNLHAIYNGILLRDLKNRYTPPLSYYLTAASMYALGESSFAARLPFAICGLLSVALILFWLWRQQADLWWWALVAGGVLGNASLFLYGRQSRYYGLAMLLSIPLTYLYLRWKGSTRDLVWMAILGVALAGTHYLNYVGLCATLCVDYLLWRRHERALSGVQWLILLAPQVVAFALLLSIYNPVGRMPDVPGHNIFRDKLVLIGWSLRDLNACEYGVGILMLAAPILFWMRREVWLMRAFVATLVYVAAVSICSSQPVGRTSVADMRYLCPMIPLCIYLTAGVLRALVSLGGSWVVPVAVLAFATNVLHAPLSVAQWRSTPWMLIREIQANRTTSLMVASDWINQHVAPGQSILVLPGYQAYPLMFHAPHPIYAWQLQPPVDRQFHRLPIIHLFGAKPVDWIIAFGPEDASAQQILAGLARGGVAYEREGMLDIFHNEAIRPELFWRSFTEVKHFDRATEAVYIYRLKQSAESPAEAPVKE